MEKQLLSIRSVSSCGIEDSRCGTGGKDQPRPKKPPTTKTTIKQPSLLLVQVLTTLTTGIYLELSSSQHPPLTIRKLVYDLVYCVLSLTSTSTGHSPQHYYISTLVNCILKSLLLFTTVEKDVPFTYSVTLEVESPTSTIVNFVLIVLFLCTRKESFFIIIHARWFTTYHEEHAYY